MIELIIIIGDIWLVSKWEGPDPDETCPHCGYYCTGKSAWCTKHPDSVNAKTPSPE